ncbi:hypothetical protein EMCRGX_G023124 [Ephydatia muelleri]|eukprot:Em0017g502a
MSFRLKFKPNIVASRDRKGSSATPTTVATPERGSVSCPVPVSASESLTKESCRLIISSAETLDPGILDCGDDCMDPSAGEMVGSLVTISNGESDLENILAKRASVVRECLDDGVPLDDTYHLPAEEGCVSYEDDAIGLDDAMPLGPLDDAIPLDDSDVIPLEASALLSSPHNVTDVEAVLDQRQASPSESSCTVSSSVTPAEGNSPHHPHDQAAGRGGQEEQSSETKSHGKKRTRKSTGTPGVKRKRKKDDDVSSEAGVPKKPKVREAPNRATMTMQELIYYNPTANPMSGTVEEKQQEDEVVAPLEEPSGVDKDKSHSSKEEDQGDEDDQGRLVPKLKIGADGSIIIDEASMFVESSRKATVFDRELIREYSGNATSSSFRKTYKITKWTKEETNLFFRALSQVGTDFTIMTLLLPKRTRKELKNKFKKEEKLRPHLVSDALQNQGSH